jgi:hypothetical protein
MAQTAKSGPNVSIKVSDLIRVAGTNQVAEDCFGAGSKVQGGVTMLNQGIATVNVQVTVTLAAGLFAVPGTCTTTGGGTCQVVNASTLTYSNPTLGTGQTSGFFFLSQIGDAVSAGTSLCTSYSFVVDGGAPSVLNSCLTTNCQPVGPGLIPTGLLPPSDQKAGSVLIYNIYTSSPTAPGSQNTRFSITNVDPDRGTAVHLFFVDGATCSIADRYICLTPSQTMTFIASEQDPGTTGYLVAVATDTLGCPINFNHLIGDAYVKFSTGHEANLGAEGISALAGGLPLCNLNSVTALLSFDGVSYGLIPRVLASSSIPARADGNDTLLILNRIQGNLAIGAATLGTLFGILYDDAEQPHSFQLTGSCQLRFPLTNVSPRTTPRFEVVIPAGQSGWLKVYNAAADIGILGAQINFNPNGGAASGAFSHGRNLHKLKLTTSAGYTIPIFPPNC